MSTAWIEIRRQKKAGDGPIKGENDIEKARKWHTWTFDDEPTSRQIDHTLVFDETAAKPGETFLLRVVARDNRLLSDNRLGLDLTPQETAGPWKTIRIVDRETAVEANRAALDKLRNMIRKLLEKQVRNQLRTLVLAQTHGADERTALGGEVRTVQIDIQKEGIRIVKSIVSDARTEDLLIKRDWNKLAFGAM